jgi:hypothetical protein
VVKVDAVAVEANVCARFGVLYDNGRARSDDAGEMAQVAEEVVVVPFVKMWD